MQAVGFAAFAAGAFLYDRGHKVEEDKSIAAGEVRKAGRWKHMHVSTALGADRTRACEGRVRVRWRA